MIKKTSDSFKRYIPQLIIGPMLKMIEAVFDLLIPLFMKSIIDLSRNGTFSSLWHERYQQRDFFLPTLVW